MIKAIPVTLVVVVAIIGVALAMHDTANPINSTNISTSSDTTNNVDVANTSTDNNKSVDNMISSSEAQKKASEYINQSGASAGTAQLVNQDGKKVYIVPVIYNGETAGEIYIDAETGKNLGGAGGA
jgi:uncharacterized membrane protein YkoI